MILWIVKTRKWIELVFLIWFARFIKLFALIAPYRLGVWAGGVIGFFAYFLLHRERKRAIEHLSSVFAEKGDQWIRRTARRSFVHLGNAVLEIALISPRRLARVFDFHGEEAPAPHFCREKGRFM